MMDLNRWQEMHERWIRHFHEERAELLRVAKGVEAEGRMIGKGVEQLVEMGQEMLEDRFRKFNGRLNRLSDEYVLESQFAKAPTVLRLVRENRIDLLEKVYQIVQSIEDAKKRNPVHNPPTPAYWRQETKSRGFRAGLEAVKNVLSKTR